MKQVKTTLNSNAGHAGSCAGAPAQKTAASASTSAQSTNQSSYEGLAYETIVTGWLAQHGIFGDVCEGARNTTLYQIGRDLRYIMDFNVERMLQLLPEWGLTEQERQTTLQSAVASPRGTEIPQGVKALLADLQRANASDTDEAPLADKNPLPEVLPPLLTTIRKMHPRFPKAAVLASLPALGTLLTNLRAKYADGEVQSPIFFTVIQAPQASGKSFARRLSDWLVKPLKEHDQQERQKEKDYRKELKQKKNAKEQPEEPEVLIRTLPATVSNTVLLKRADVAKGMALYTFAEEIDTIARSNKAGAWAQKNDIYRLAFDGAVWGQDYMAENSYSAEVPLRYNLLFLGTPLAVSKFFSKVEDGMASRFMLAQLPDTRGEALQRPVPISKLVRQQCADLIKAAFEEGQGVAELNINLTKTLIALDNWQLERIMEYNADPDNFALDILRRRAGVLGFRAAMIAWWLCGKKETQDVVNFALWVANEVLQQQLIAFGEEMNRIERESMDVTKRHEKNAITGRNGRLLAGLPESFTKGDVIVARRKLGRTGEVAYVITRWLNAGLIERSQQDPQSYVKVRKEAEDGKVDK